MLTTLTFHPQAWQNDYAVDVDPEGETTLQVESGLVAGLRSNRHESDELRNHERAPKWWGEWSGPFWIEIDDPEEE